jgi:starvation-inducible DNA-binding protein
MTKPNIGIDDKGRSEVAAALSKLLGETYALYVKTQGFHWNVTGPQFPHLHEMFGTQYEELADVLDEVAERIRALGHLAPGSFSQLARLTTIKEETAAPKAEVMIEQLLEGHEVCSKAARAVQKKAADAGDEATADLAIGRMESHDKAAWMLRSTLGG